MNTDETQIKRMSSQTLTEARRADIFVENEIPIKNKLRQERHNLLVDQFPNMPLLTEVAAPLAMENYFSGDFYKYAAPTELDTGGPVRSSFASLANFARQLN